MRGNFWKRLLSVILVVAMLSAYAVPANAADDTPTVSIKQVDNSAVSAKPPLRDPVEPLEEEIVYADTDVVRVSIVLEKPGTIEAGFSPISIAGNNAAMAYRDKLENEQQSVVGKIENVIQKDLDVVWNLTLAANIISANVEFGKIESIKQVAGIKDVILETRYSPDVVSAGGADPNMATSSAQIGSSAVWASGYTGAGSKIAVIDTGADIYHEAFDAAAFDFSIGQLGREVDLMDVSDISAVLEELHAYESRVTEADLYVNSKIPFGFNYVDGDLDIEHVNDYMGEHGSHVSGIATANAYINNGDGTFSPSLDTTYVQGVAPDAQLMVMKVFGKNGGAYDSDYMAAIEDAVILGADSVNLSLGSGNPGMSRVSSTYRDLMESLVKSGVVVVMSAGNSGYWVEAAQNGIPYLFLDDVSMQTNGSPGSYTNAFTVASMDNDGFTTAEYFTVAGNIISYAESPGYANNPLITLAGEQEFVLVDCIGELAQFEDVGAETLAGKIVMCYRGTTSFYEKANNAVSLGAAGVVIINNTDGFLYMDLTDYQYTAPVVSMLQADGEFLKMLGTEHTTQNGITYWTGTMNISDKPGVGQYNSEYYTMSSFSSWGVPGSLELKPEIAAPGGSIYSVAGAIVDGTFSDHASYEIMSGTSMAAPQVTGMAALMAQYVREAGLVELTGLDERTLAQSLLMSTAVPMRDGNSGGNYYPVIQQGAGLGNVGKATAADSYIMMGSNATASWADGKIKAELGDDPSRTGVYSFSFTVNNLTGEPKDLKLSADVFTQDAFEYNGNLLMDTWTANLTPSVSWSINGKTVRNNTNALEGMDFNGNGTVDESDGQHLLDYATGMQVDVSNPDKADLNGDGAINSYDAYLFLSALNESSAALPAYGTADVTVTITLSNADREWLANYENGAYIEAYIYAETVSSDEGVAGTVHSIPMLAFYGNWSDPSMFDKGSYMEYAYGLENRPPYLYETAFGQNYFNSLFVTYSDMGGEYPFGGNPLITESTYKPERNAISAVRGDVISSVGFTSIRNAADGQLYVANAETGELYFLRGLGQVDSAFYYVNGGAWKNTYYFANAGFSFADIPEGTPLEIGLTLVPEYYVDDEGNVNWDALGEGATFSMPLVIDNTAPTVKDVAIDTENEVLTVSATDNQYIASVALYDIYGEHLYVNAPGPEDNVAPEDTVEIMLNLAEVNGPSFLLQVYDYAMNTATYEITTQIGEVTDAVEGIEIDKTQLVMQKGTTQSLTAAVLPVYASNRNVVWTTSDASVVSVDAAGNLTANAAGTATITAAAEADETVTATCAVEVIDISNKMNAIVWDEVGAIWFSEFAANDLSGYTKLSPDMQSQDYFTTAAVAGDGTLYASSMSPTLESGAGSLYTVDPATYEATLLADINVQGLDIFFSDMTYAPAMFGTGALLGTYGPYVIAMDPVTGECISIIDELNSNLVGIACCGSSLNDNNGTLVYQDAVFLIENDGTVIQEVYYGYDGAVVPYYSYFEGTRISMETGISVDGAWYYNSAHYDGDYLYWTAFNEETDSAVTLYAIDFTTGNVYNMGQFADNVWPVSGLHQQIAGNSVDKVLDEETLANVAGRDIATAEIQLVPRTISVKEAEAGGSLNALAGTSDAAVRPMSNVKMDCKENKVTVEITAKDLEGNSVLSHNGVVNVVYDTQALTLDTVENRTDYLAINHNADSVTIGYVDLVGVAADETVAVLTFTINSEEETSVTVEHKEVNEDAMMGYTETLELDPANPHTLAFVGFAINSDYSSATASYWCESCGTVVEYAADLTCEVTKEPTCTEEGEAQYTVSHGENSDVVSVVLPTVEHKYENGICTGCGQSEDTVDSGACGDNLRWYLTQDGTLTISGTGDMYDYGLRNNSPWYNYCDMIVSVVVEEGVTSIGAHAFSSCRRLDQFRIPASVSKIGRAPFRHATSLTEFVLAEGNTAFCVVDNALLSADGTQLIAYPAQLTGVYTVPNTVTTIWEFAFANSAVTKLILPDSVKVLETYSLYNLWHVEEVVLGNGIETICTEALAANYFERLSLPASVRDIAEGAFLDTRLKSIEVDENNQYYRSVDGILYSADMTMLHTCPVRLEQSSIEIPETVTTIANYAFAGCGYVSNIRFRGDAPAIGEYSFDGAMIVATYPAGNDTWTEEVRQDYGGILYWYADTEPLTILFQPESQSCVENAYASFEVYAMGDMPSYCWQYRMSESEEWKDYKVGSHFCGMDAVAENDGMQLRCLVTDAKGNQVYTNVVTLTVKYPKLENSKYAGYSLDDLVLGADGIYRTPDGRTVYIAVNNEADGGIQYWLGGNTLYEYVESYGSDYFDLTHWEALLALMDENGYAVLTEESLQYLITLVTGNPAWGETVNEVPNYLFYDREAPEEPEKPGITVTSQPVDYVGMVGDMATFTVGAEGEDLKYQWYFSSDDGATWQKSSGTLNTLTIEFKAYRLNYQYYCQITDAAGNTVTTNTVKLLAEEVELKILTQPVSYVGAVNDEVTFTVEATGNGLVYEWFYSEDGTTWAKSYSPGYQTNVLSPVLRTHRDGNQYRCVITDIFGNSVTSDAVSMTVKASDVIIVKQPESKVNCILGQLYEFTVEATGENLTYRWEFSDDGGNTWQESWNDGYNTATLNVRMNANRDGNQYRCVVTSGLKTVVISDPAVLDLQDPSVEIISNSGNVYVVANRTATFTVTAEGRDLTYLWYRSNDDGATWFQTYLDGYNTDTLSFVATTNRAAKYCCKITDGSGKVVWSAPVKLQILSAELAILEQPVSVTCQLGETAKFTVKAQGDSLKYRWYVSADGGETWTMSYLDGYNTAEFSFVVNAVRAAKVYKCVVTDAAGNTVETDVVSVTVG